MSKYKFHKANPDPVLTINAPNEPNAVTFFSAGVEVLRCSPDGFWVRGVRVEQDDTEAQTVYNAFKAWMTWAQLNKDYQ